MISCTNCYFWLTHNYRLGVCTFEPSNPGGTIAPVSADAVGIQLALEWSGATATAEDTLCENWEPVDESALELLELIEEDDD